MDREIKRGREIARDVGRERQGNMEPDRDREGDRVR